jgi:hypothetical protein
MEAGYYETSTIYVIGYALAHKRLLTVEGAYAKLDVFQSGFARALETDLEHLEEAFDVEGRTSVSFYRYERRALADFLLKWDGVWRVLSYAEFAAAARLDGAGEVTGPVRGFLTGLTEQQASRILRAVSAALQTLQSATGAHIADAIANAGYPTVAPGPGDVP